VDVLIAVVTVGSFDLVGAADATAVVGGFDFMSVLAVDVGGPQVKILASGKRIAVNLTPALT
jgi:hypothetical protein